MKILYNLQKCVENCNNTFVYSSYRDIKQKNEYHEKTTASFLYIAFYGM